MSRRWSAAVPRVSTGKSNISNNLFMDMKEADMATKKPFIHDDYLLT